MPYMTKTLREHNIKIYADDVTREGETIKAFYLNAQRKVTALLNEIALEARNLGINPHEDGTMLDYLMVDGQAYADAIVEEDMKYTLRKNNALVECYDPDEEYALTKMEAARQDWAA